MTREALENYLAGFHFKKDRYGHFISPTGEYRYKFQARSVRYERKIHHPAGNYSPARNEWMRLYSGFYSEISISPENRLLGFKR